VRRGVDPPARAALRREKAKPVLDALKEWLDREHRTAPPKTQVAEAIIYSRNQWDTLNTYVNDGDLTIDNNAAERAVEPFAIR
jgi:transposase